ncbi:isoprenylcysteine carboxyl methyltransferase family protein [Bhargavaea beijingensis]|uniref:15-methylpalmitoyl-4-hydroxy-2-pyrone 4-O-methyltransferase n=1 Tax=Bhargavaea beijingensis TaxID=426756 RepID=A0A1G7EN39_9BACL|nr:isoprenylcysteine carboxyl methyltransferase family protein [Bhargavaea beijingensis]RSK25319.1 isoprenylcysteine carboxyl methyltransferase [Bhargavaea beijingensis]SDE65042.1 15-methylpalmitoyl-4-hydroxy-2-pyrone 4-O-methyltransferase [Bhargavaea beijingensis]
MLFWILIGLVIIQRLVELRVAKRNEQKLKSRGAFEAGASHYPYMVAMHIGFFISLIAEVLLTDRPLSPIWPVLLAVFLAMQVLRVWCLASLGEFWNTKIIILPGASVVKRGPYKWLRHPNYVIVTTELLVLPLIFQAYFTTIVFMALNAWMLSVRIPAEERALREVTDYTARFGAGNSRTS